MDGTLDGVRPTRRPESGGPDDPQCILRVKDDSLGSGHAPRGTDCRVPEASHDGLYVVDRACFGRPPSRFVTRLTNASRTFFRQSEMCSLNQALFVPTMPAKG